MVYKCPYCGRDSYVKNNNKKFESWKSVLGHLSNCKEIKNIDSVKQFVIKQLQDYTRIYGKIPQSRDFLNNTEGFTTNSIKRYFGSWNKAIEAAGLVANYNNGLGQRTVAKDGVLYRSQLETYFVNNYLYNKHKYIYEVKYTDGSNKTYDFYLPELDLYIELTAGLKPEVINTKITINKEQNKKLLIIQAKDLYKKEFKLDIMQGQAPGAR